MDNGLACFILSYYYLFLLIFLRGVWYSDLFLLPLLPLDIRRYIIWVGFLAYLFDVVSFFPQNSYTLNSLLPSIP
ncbi:hypothetical protein B9Z19DRAFT_1087697 [Tuber borchii]|uniref:Uncharacterized protein n=1 Tax=Tuber borchii TaxID=42251 RepID=A0A2T6ZMH5_TUBBO|nr:hypothetical protein B9Z19DRAFT_1087697 [Tuber borchii]